MKTALITGVTGQDGCYLAKNLLEKGYKVYGAVKHTTGIQNWRLDEMGITNDIEYVDVDIVDQANVRRMIDKTQPDEVYNLAAQSFVALSFEQPEMAALIDGVGVLRVLETIYQVNPEIKFYQASTSELFGKVQEIPQNENTKFYPRSPYACAKLYGHTITINYRESYNMFACSGILFNHESPMRGSEFVTRKITKGIVNWMNNKKIVTLGTIEAQRDWGHAEDYVEGMRLMLQQDKPKDYVLATGETHSVKQFATKVLDKLNIKHHWTRTRKESQQQDDYGNLINEGVYIDECYTDDKHECIITTDEKYKRPAEVDLLIGDSTKARTELGWKPKFDLDMLIDDMLKWDLKRYG
jgi:GDPmannose 4,6-dehydratase